MRSGGGHRPIEYSPAPFAKISLPLNAYSLPYFAKGMLCRQLGIDAPQCQSVQSYELVRPVSISLRVELSTKGLTKEIVGIPLRRFLGIRDTTYDA